MRSPARCPTLRLVAGRRCIGRANSCNGWHRIRVDRERTSVDRGVKCDGAGVSSDGPEANANGAGDRSNGARARCVGPPKRPVGLERRSPVPARESEGATIGSDGLAHSAAGAPHRGDGAPARSAGRARSSAGQVPVRNEVRERSYDPEYEGVGEGARGDGGLHRADGRHHRGDGAGIRSNVPVMEAAGCVRAAAEPDMQLVGLEQQGTGADVRTAEEDARGAGAGERHDGQDSGADELERCRADAGQRADAAVERLADRGVYRPDQPYGPAEERDKCPHSRTPSTRARVRRAQCRDAIRARPPANAAAQTRPVSHGGCPLTEMRHPVPLEADCLQLHHSTPSWLSAIFVPSPDTIRKSPTCRGPCSTCRETDCLPPDCCLRSWPAAATPPVHPRPTGRRWRLRSPWGIR